MNIPDQILNAISKTTVEIKVLLDLAVANGEMRYETDSARYFDLLSKKFPVTFSRIDWTKVPDKVSVSAFQHKQRGTFDMEHHLVESMNFIQNLEPQIAEADTIILIGDNAIVGAYLMDFITLKKYFPYICMLSQHTYIIPAETHWCLNYTMEDDLYFGFAP
jgi:hypothetical protein